MTFYYEARDSRGLKVSGEMNAAHEQEILEILGDKDLMVVLLERIETKTRVSRRPAGRIPQPILSAFTRQLATMLHAGLPLINCLTSLKRQAKNRRLQATLETLIAYIENGASLSEALSQNSQEFSPLYVHIVKAGEKGGALPEMLDRLVTYLDMSVRLRQRIRSAMMYPAIVSVMGIGISIFLVTTIIPVFVDIYKEFQHRVPLPTLILIQTSTWIRAHLLTNLGVALAIVLLVRRFLYTPRGVEIWDQTKLRLPVFGPLVEKIALSRFARTFGTLTNSGVPVLQALDTVAKAVNNVVIEATVSRVRAEIEGGAAIVDAMERQQTFPPMMLEMVATGEQAGKVGDMLIHVANHYDREVDDTLAGLTSLMEPLLILFLGIVVGSVVVAMFLPIFRMTDVIKF
jgi:type IV pilus assembly protein PilC